MRTSFLQIDFNKKNKNQKEVIPQLLRLDKDLINVTSSFCVLRLLQILYMYMYLYLCKLMCK